VRTQSQWPLDEAFARGFWQGLEKAKPQLASDVRRVGWDALTDPKDVSFAVGLAMGLFEKFGAIRNDFLEHDQA
jgi:hypothetical protein